MTQKYNTETGEAIASQPFEPSRPGSSCVSYDTNSSNGLPSGINPHQIAARGFAQAFGLHPAVAFVTVAVDLMVSAAVIGSGGLLIPLSLGAGAFLGYITYKAQMKWYADDDESAKIKALIVALLTAIPSPLPYVLFVPAGIVGLFRKRS